MRIASLLVLRCGAVWGDVGRGLRVVENLGEGEHVERVVELTVPAGVQAVAIGASGGDGDRGASGDARELGVAGEPADPGDLADQLRGDQLETSPRRIHDELEAKH